MPTTTDVWGIVKPASDLEPADLYGVATRLADSVESALVAPYVSLLASAATTSIANNTNTKVNLATTVHNDTDYFTVAASVVTILQTRLYDIYGYEQHSAVGSGLTLALVSKNGLTTGVAAQAGAAASGFWAGAAVNWHVPLNAGDTLQLVTKHNAGSSISDDGVGRLLVRLSG